MFLYQRVGIPVLNTAQETVLYVPLDSSKYAYAVLHFDFILSFAKSVRLDSSSRIS